VNVEGWLKDLGLEQYAEAFAENDVDGDALTGGEPSGESQLIYEKGRGVSQDLAAAVRWYSKAAKQGNPIAIGRFARLKRNHPEAVR